MKIEYEDIFKIKNDYKFRSELIRNFSFAIPTEEAINELIKYNPLIEIGAGTGYWAYLINKYGGDIIAFDNNERDDEWNNVSKEKYFKKNWFDVKYGNEKMILNFPNRTLFMCWIEYGSEIGLECLKLYKKNYFLYIGEDGGGCCATDSFFDYLKKHWKLKKTINIPQWSGIRDYFNIFKRK